MADRLDHDVRGQNSTYPWDEWLDGQPRRLHEGQDYTITLAGMRAMAHEVAKRRGLKVRTNSGPGYLDLQAIHIS